MPRKSKPRRPGPDHHPDDDTEMSGADRAGLVAEAAQTFGEEAARELAGLLHVPFEACQQEVQP